MPLTTLWSGGFAGPATPWRASAPARGWNTCWCRWSSASAHRWSPWSAPISAPDSASTAALRVALIGGGMVFVMTETVGLAAAIWPTAWLGLFGGDPQMLDTGSAYLRMVAPAYGFFGLGLSLYFASQERRKALCGHCWPACCAC